MCVLRMVVALVAWPLLVSAAPAQPPLPVVQFDALDADGNGEVTRSEWLAWMLAHTDEEDDVADARSPFVVIKDATGVERRLVARPRVGGADAEYIHPSFDENRITSPVAARARLLRDQGLARPVLDFSAYDVDGNGVLTRAEVHPSTPDMGNPIPNLSPMARP